MLKLLALTQGVVILSISCGAPTKTPSEVAYIFDDSKTLQDKLDESCTALKESSNFQDKTKAFKNLECGGAGIFAINFDDASRFNIVGLDEKKGSTDQETVPIEVRSQVWMNKTLIRLAGVFLSKIDGNLDPSQSSFTDLLTNVEGLQEASVPENLVRFKAKDLGGEINLDQGVSLTQKLNLKAEGIVEFDIDIQISANSVGGALVFQISTLNVNDSSSILKNIEIVAFIIGHAQDTYVDFFFSLEMTNFGHSEQIKSMATDLLESQIKTILDGLLEGSPEVSNEDA